MKKSISFVLVFLLLSLFECINSENILFLLPISSKSHKNVYDPLINVLAKKGHNLTVISCTKSSNPLPNVHDIVPVTAEEVFINYLNPFEDRKLSTVSRLAWGVDHLIKICHKVYQNEKVQNLLKNGKFDLVIVNGIGNHCFFPMLYQFKAPTMALLTLPASNFNTEKLGTHLPPSHIPLSFLEYTERMNFKQKLVNTAIQWGLKVAEQVYYKPLFRKIKNQYHGESWPEIGEIERNLSMLLINSHLSMNPLLPLLPDIVEIGGMHCRPSKPIQQQELKEWLDDAKNGFIYFSFGSIIQGNTMPEKYRKTFINVFSKLKVKVLWKWETETMPDLPSNVKLSKWLPQQDILGHPNILMFITHGGLLSTQEAVFHAVPLIGIPFFADQDLNTAQAEKRGFAKKLEILDLTEEILEDAIKEVLENPKYQNKAMELSKIFRDQPQTPLERAVFWVEYVIRNKGAHHLRSAARDLNLFQYHSLDTIGFLFGLIVLILWICKKILCFIISRCCSRKSLALAKSKKSKNN